MIEQLNESVRTPWTEKSAVFPVFPRLWTRHNAITLLDFGDRVNAQNPTISRRKVKAKKSSASPKAPKMINIEPPTANFPASGGNATHNIVSETDSRLAFKVKSSNNEHYRVRPVYGFVDGKGKAALEINRLAGPAKEDKIVVQYAEVPAEETDPQAPFKAGAQQGETILKLVAT
ncbi:unnamed protein product [Caenorhabditis sp. 36 PRJEB53466]|nr:unnamed protein product [Caenorhabditis sp. 36 PRJEB53466]